MTSTFRLVYDRLAPTIAIILIIACAILAGATYVNDRNDARQDRERLRDNEENARIGCENANETREASRVLWNYVFDVSTARNQDATPEEQAYMTEIRDWIGKVYAERDCSDLSREYPIPSPPALPTPG